MEWEVGVSRCKLLYTGWTNNKVLLYSTGNYTQYPMTNHNGEEYFFLNVYKREIWDFPGGTVVRNPPAHAGDAGLIPGPGRSHVPWSN